MIEARGTSVVLAGKRVLRDVWLSIAAGEMAAVLGPNGSGKSTLVRTLAGLIRPVEGSVMLSGRPIRGIPSREIARTLAVVGQSGGCVPALTVEQHVALGRHPHRSPWWFLAGDGVADRAAIEESLTLCDIAALRGRIVETLSGGERQRVRLATALAQRPRLLMLDEPLVGLDIEHQLELLALLRGLNADRGLTVVVVLHDLDHALRHFGRALVIDGGRK